MNNSTDNFQEQDDLVYYCKSCHSLLVLVDEDVATPWWDGSYCGKCNCTDIGTCSIDEWLEEEEKKTRIRNERNKER